MVQERRTHWPVPCMTWSWAVGIDGDAALVVGGVGLGAEPGADADGVVIELDADLHGAGVVAGFAEVLVGDAEVEEAAVGADGAAQVVGGTDIILVKDGLIAVIEHDHVIGDAGVDVDAGQVGVGFGIAGVGGSKQIDFFGFAEGALGTEGHDADDQAGDGFEADGAAVDAAGAGSAYGVGREGTDVAGAVGRSDAVGDAEQDPVPFAVLGFERRSGRRPGRDLEDRAARR